MLYVWPTIAYLDAVYAAPPRPPRSPASEATFTMSVSSFDHAREASSGHQEDTSDVYFHDLLPISVVEFVRASGRPDDAGDVDKYVRAVWIASSTASAPLVVAMPAHRY